jgi:Fe-S cluster assembly iron-binding protein IscA
MTLPRLAPALLLAALAGCTPRPTATSTAVPAAPRPFVEVTPAARELLWQVARDQKFGADWWVRLTVEWRPGAQVVLTVERNPPGPNDVAREADGLRVVMAGDQVVYLKGARIDLVQEEDRVGFDVTFPHRDAGDRQAANEWLRKASAKK